MAQASVELNELGAGTPNGVAQQQYVQENSEVQIPGPGFSLPPVDGGKKAWLFLAACWVVEAMVFGFGFSFGIFQEYYSNHKPFAGTGNVAIIGTTTMGTLYVGTPFVLALCRLYTRSARWFTLVGLLIASLSMALSSLCSSVPQLVATQGIIFGIGGCFAYCPCVMYIDEWFAQRKGMAYGIVWSASGFGGVILPLLLQTLLNHLGFKTATRVWAIVLFAVSAPLSFFIRPRLPYSGNTRTRLLNMRYFTSRLFILHSVANIIQAAGYFLPGIYLPTYARTAFGASNSLSTLTIILLNMAGTFGCIIMGTLTDKIQVTTCVIISATGAASSVLLFWGLSASLPVLYLFCVFYGMFAGCWTTVWPGIMKEISRRGESEGYGYVDPIMVFGLLCMERGVGNIISGPLSDVLLKGMPWLGQAVAGYGSGYGVMIVFTGLTGLASGLTFLWKQLHLL
ncbi:MFS general substrate transporter [Polychaeton citri CBS 116435]|uniref:MFS general substrate transporter n=1 Tax=Polychaeton citri CBS 116435 TaxID=1314669 RepID=A0A9P4UPP5_9PEZI|nr:MFS general substrate transporter [Polychaeton citri CBS 116435]